MEWLPAAPGLQAPLGWEAAPRAAVRGEALRTWREAGFSAASEDWLGEGHSLILCGSRGHFPVLPACPQCGCLARHESVGMASSAGAQRCADASSLGELCGAATGEEVQPHVPHCKQWAQCH